MVAFGILIGESEYNLATLQKKNFKLTIKKMVKMRENFELYVLLTSCSILMVMPAMIGQQVSYSFFSLKKKKLERIAFSFYYRRGPPF